MLVTCPSKKLEHNIHFEIIWFIIKQRSNVNLGKLQEQPEEYDFSEKSVRKILPKN